MKVVLGLVAALVGAVVALLGVVAVAGGPSSSDRGDRGDRGDGEAVMTERVQSSPRQVERSALDDPTATAFPRPLIDPEELLPGGPPPDGIPALDDPRFVRAATAAFLDDDEPVVAIEVDGEARAYPVQIMIWHEIVNDTIADRPVTVSSARCATPRSPMTGGSATWCSTSAHRGCSTARHW